MEFKLTDFFAIYGAILSTFIFIWSAIRMKAKIKIKIVAGSGEFNGKEDIGVVISVQNHSSKLVHLSNIMLLYPYQKKGLKVFNTILFKHYNWVYVNLSKYKIKNELPLSLDPGKSYNLFVPEMILNQILNDSFNKEIKAVVQNQLWKNQYSKKFQV